MKSAFSFNNGNVLFADVLFEGFDSENENSDYSTVNEDENI